ncbi:MAG: N-methylhydantoinase A [Chloroflexi bacterium]|jgi:N-methylhydantoinase A|nr:MAG: N-methylhydantoinase A [Chloroflexota bacterium]
MIVIGIDTGGTFTDMVVLDQESGAVKSYKTPSTPDDPSRAVEDALKELFADGGKGEDILSFSHGITLGTNLLLQGKGATVGILVTEGFTGISDVWQVPRFGPDMYKIFVEKQPFVLPRYREEVRERVDSVGNVLVELDVEQATEAVRRLAAKGVDSVAAVLLFSFLNPQHERTLGEIINKEMPGASVSLSSQVAPQMREYPRLSTTVANARLAPTLDYYFSTLEKRLRDAGISTKQIYIMQSNGGVASIGNVTPITTVLSGPCAGAQAGVSIGEAAGYPNVVSVDMGGTSTDIAVGEDGRILEKTSGMMEDWELIIPMLTVHTIGAGGGTIAWLDRVGSLQVGPQSAGAAPGPVCYGKGGTEPTITDCNVLLGILPDHLLGGRVQLDKAKAAEAVAALGEKLGLGMLETAEGIIRIINAKMVEGIRAAAAEHGYDLTDFALIGFGGAGPVHATRLAAELAMKKVIIPPIPGLTSALGLLLADLRRDYVRSRMRLLTEMDPAELNSIFDELREQAMKDLVADGFHENQIRLEFSLDLRYLSQGYEVSIPAGIQGSATKDDLLRLRNEFDETHDRSFGHSNSSEPVEAVHYRARAYVVVPKANLSQEATSGSSAAPTPSSHREVFLSEDGGAKQWPIYDRDSLAPGNQIAGPAIVDQFDSTTVVYPGQSLEVDSFNNLIITIG